VTDADGDLSTQALTIVYPATTLNVVTSDGVTGDVDSVAVAADADILQVEEKTGVPGFDIQFAFAGVASFNNILLYSKYTGGAGHTVKLQLWNPALGSWVEVDEFTNETTFQLHNIPILNGSSYVDSDGEVELRLYHPAAGNATHYIEIDYVVLRNTNDFSGGGGVTHHSNLTGLADDDHTQYALLAGRGGETLVIDAINFTDSTTFIHMDSAGALIFEDAIGGPYELSELAAGGSSTPYKLISYTDCADNATTDIVIGTTADVTYIVHYIAERNMGTVQKQAGTLTVLYDDVTGAVSVF